MHGLDHQRVLRDQQLIVIALRVTRAVQRPPAPEQLGGTAAPELVEVDLRVAAREGVRDQLADVLPRQADCGQVELPCHGPRRGGQQSEHSGVGDGSQHRGGQRSAA